MSDPNENTNSEFQNPENSNQIPSNTFQATGGRTVHIQSQYIPRTNNNQNPKVTSHMKFANREGRIRMTEIANLDLNNIIKTNNIMSLEQFAENLIYADINPDDYEDKNIVKLIKTFQYALEYLNNKQNELENANSTLENDYNQLINESYSLEERLKTNKAKISKYNNDKKARLMLIETYRSIINYHINPGEEENIVINHIEKISQERSGAKYYCHICSGKPFSSEEKLESHMKRRHNAQVEFNPLEESFDNYEKQINDIKNYFENIIKQREDEQFKYDYMNDLERMKKQNKQELNDMENRLKDTLDQFRDFIIKTSLQQRNQVIEAQVIPEEKESKKEEKIIIQNPQIDQFDSLKKSIQDLGELVKLQHSKKMEDFQRQIDNLRKSQSQIKDRYDKTEINISQNRVQKPIEQQPENISSKFNPPETKPIIISENKVPEEKKEEKKIEILRNVKKDSEEKEKKEILNPMIQEKTLVIGNPNNNPFALNQDNINVNTGNSFLPKAPALNKTQELPKEKKKKFKPLVFRGMNKTMENLTKEDELELFFINFTNRDNEIFEEEEPKINDISKVIIPKEVKQDQNLLTQTLNKSIIEQASKENIPLDDFMDKNKMELIEIIDNTLKNISEINKQNQISEIYYNTVQKAIDLKIYEADKEMMKNAINEKNGELKKKEIVKLVK